MPKLPIISGKGLIKAFAKIGYEIDHQTGSHIILRHKMPPHRRLTIPNHSEIARGTLRAIIRQAGLSRDEFFELLGK
jgi:predicted RNA binding protein YcfA (HicA-like mRNA interferase family)